MTNVYDNISPNKNLTMATARQKLEEALEVKIREKMEENLSKWQNDKNTKNLSDNQAVLAVYQADTTEGQQSLIFATKNQIYRGFNEIIEDRMRRINLPDGKNAKIKVPPEVINQELTLLKVLQKLMIKWLR